MSSFPALFISHGSPDLLLRGGAVRDFLSELGQQFDRPKAILCISAHWNTSYPIVSAASLPQTIHDFSGFPRELYQMQYPAKGSPDLAAKVVDLLNAAGIQSDIHPNRGLDHGAWNPLMLIYPDADVPVTQLSIQAHLNPEHHLAVGQALEPLRNEGVLVLASGSATHNLGELGGYSYNAAPPEWVEQFADWLTDTVTKNKVDELLNYRAKAPYAIDNHPTDEHLLPLFVALGAGGKATKGSLLHSSFTYGLLSMAAYSFS